MAESAWGWLGKTATAVKQASEKVQQSVEALPTPPLADMNRNIGMALGKIMSSGDATGDAAAAPADDYLPWAVPRGWAQRSEAWVALSKGLVEQEATFLIGPERGLTKLETQTLKLQGVTVDFNTESAAADYDRISSAVLDYAPLSKMRFNLVPKYISEDSFWLNYVWKLHEVAKTDSVQREDYPDEGIRAPGSAKVFAGLSDRTALLDAVDALVRAVGEGEERRVEAAQGTRQQAAVLDLYGEGMEALQMLDDCLADARRAGVLDDMTRCFYDTCCSCRERLRIEVEAGEGAGGGGGGGGSGGEFSKLMHLATRLDATVAAYDAFAASPSPAAESAALGSAEKKRPAAAAAAAAPHRTSPKPSAMPAPPAAPPALDEDDDDDEETAVVATAARAVAAPAVSPQPCAGTESTSADSFVHVSRDGLSGALALPEGASQAASSPVSTGSPPVPPQAAPSSVEATAAATARPGSSSSPSNQFSALPWDSDDDN